jgi:hypothetical protein
MRCALKQDNRWSLLETISISKEYLPQVPLMLFRQNEDKAGLWVRLTTIHQNRCLFPVDHSILAGDSMVLTPDPWMVTYRCCRPAIGRHQEAVVTTFTDAHALLRQLFHSLLLYDGEFQMSSHIES